MNPSAKRKLIVKPIIGVLISLALALFVIYFIPYQLSKISILSGQDFPSPSYLGYFIVLGFTFKPILNLIENLFLLKKWENGENPSCPICSFPMTKRLAKRGKFAGQEFWGCFSYPKCSGKIHIG